MPNDQPKEFDTIAKVESLLDAPILIKLAAFAFYAEFVLRYIYGVSFVGFGTFSSLRDFVFSIRPLSLALIVVGASLVPRVGLVAWRMLQQFLFSPTYYFRKSEREKNDKLFVEGAIMYVRRGKELARKRRDEYLLAECEKIEEEERKIVVTKINVAAIFVITGLNLILYLRQPDTGLIMHSLLAQIAFLLAIGTYAGVYPPERYDWVRVPDGYTQDEINSPRYRRVKKLSPIAGMGEQSDYVGRAEFGQTQVEREMELEP